MSKDNGLGFFEKRKVKSILKKMTKVLQKHRSYYNKLVETGKKIEVHDLELLDKYKVLLIDGILGNEDKDSVGMIELFEITDDDGKPLSEEEIRSLDIDELMDLSEGLINELSKEI